MTRPGIIPATAPPTTDASEATAPGPARLDYDARMVPFGNTAWIACEVIHLTCVIVALYLLYALLHYRALKMMYPRIAERHRKGGVWLENLCVIAILFALVRFANNQALLFTGYVSGSRCSILINVSIAMYFVTVHPIYLFLWVRQRIFYSNRALKHLYSKTVRFLSWAALLCFVAVTVVSMVIFVVDPQNSASGRVCHYSLLNGKDGEVDYSNLTQEKGDGGRRQGVIVNTMAGLLAGGIQMSFLALFLYPIMDNKLRAVRSKHLRSGSVGLLTLIRRSFVLAGLCILSDVAIALLVKTVYNNFPDAAFAPLAMYDINLIINMICIIMTFRRWRVMLFPWLYTDTCRGLFDWLGNCTRRAHLGSAGVYHVNRQRGPLRRVFSVESTTNMERSGVSSIRYKAHNRDPCPATQVVRDPVPDVLLPMLESHLPKDEQQHRDDEEKWCTESLLADLNRNIDPDWQNYSDSVLQLARPQFERKRSSSLVIATNRSSSFKQANAKVAADLLAKSKLWIFDGKHL